MPAGNPNPDTMPVPCFNVINGGEHAGNKLAFQVGFGCSLASHSRSSASYQMHKHIRHLCC